MGRHLGGGPRPGGRFRRLQQPHDPPQPARQHRRRAAQGADLERLRQPAAPDRRRPCGAARQGAGNRARLRPQADLRRRGRHRDSRRRGRLQRPGRAGGEAARRPRRQHIPARRGAARFSDHRPLRPADQLYLAAWRLRRRDGDASRQPDRPVVLSVRRRRAGAGRGAAWWRSATR